MSPTARAPGDSNGLAGGDFLAGAEPAWALVEEDLDLGRRSIEDQVGLAVAVEVAGIDADHLLVDRDAHQPHPAVEFQIVDLLAERPGLGFVGRPLGAQKQVDPGPGVVADDDVSRLVAIQIANHQVADPPLELVHLQRLEAEIIGELGSIGGRIRGGRCCGQGENQATEPARGETVGTGEATVTWA